MEDADRVAAGQEFERRRVGERDVLDDKPRVEIADGTIIVVFGKSAESEITDRTIVLTPEFAANQEATWTCRSADIPDKRLPERCQSK